MVFSDAWLDFLRLIVSLWFHCKEASRKQKFKKKHPAENLMGTGMAHLSQSLNQVFSPVLHRAILLSHAAAGLRLCNILMVHLTSFLMVQEKPKKKFFDCVFIARHCQIGCGFTRLIAVVRSTVPISRKLPYLTLTLQILQWLRCTLALTASKYSTWLRPRQLDILLG